MHINFIIPFWGIIGIIIAIAIIVCFIIGYFGEQEGGYLGGVFHALLIMAILIGTGMVCIGMIAGKYLF